MEAEKNNENADNGEDNVVDDNANSVGEITGMVNGDYQSCLGVQCLYHLLETV